MPLTRPKAHQLSGQSAKSSVRVVTTSNVTLSGGAPATVDGVSLTLEDRILVTAQTDATENGIYRVTSVGSGSNGTWVRSRDANQNEEVLAGMTCIVSEGTSYADTFWKLTTDGAVTLGTTELTFEQHSSGGSSFANLSDVTLTSTSSNDILTYNGSAWVNNTAINLSGTITGGNLTTGNVTIDDATITATGNITTSGSFIGDGSQLTGLPAGYTDANVTSLLSNLGSNNISTAGSITVSGRVATGEVSAHGLSSTSSLTLRGGVSSDGIKLQFWDSSWTDALAIRESTHDILASYPFTATGNITGGNLLTGNVTVSDATITVDNVTYTGTDGTTGQALLTYGNGVTYFGNVATDSGATYTTGNTAPVSPSVGDKWFDTDDEILFEYINDGTSNVWVDTTSASTGDSTTGDYAITGNLTAGGNVATGNVTVTDSTISATGNITGGNVISSGSISAGGNYLSSQPSFRNLIINGDMKIAQRGTSAVSGSPNFPVDRWRIVSNQSSKFTAQQSSDVPTGQGFKNSIVFTSSSAYTEASGDYFLVQHRFEGNNIEHLHYGNASAKTVTVSFWVKSSLTGTFAGALRDGGSYTTSYIFEYTISSANTWEYKTVTISGPTSGTWLTGTSVGAELGFALGGGSEFNGTASAWQSTNDFITSSANRLVNTNGATLYITGVQLEVGSQATPFEHRMYSTELAMCQRYFYIADSYLGGAPTYPTIGAGYNVSSTEARISIQYPVMMRAKPTLSYTGTLYVLNSAGSGLAVTSIASNYGNPMSAMVAFGVASGLTQGHGTVVITNNGSGQTFQANAEL